MKHSVFKDTKLLSLILLLATTLTFTCCGGDAAHRADDAHGA